MSSSPLDLDYLTPGHFLIGQPLLAVPELPVPEGPQKLVSRWKLLHQCYQSFWRRWSSEYLQALQVRTKWATKTPNIQVGDMVVIKSNQGPPLTWRMGRILEVEPGADGIVRVARILTSHGEFIRPVVKLVLLPKDKFLIPHPLIYVLLIFRIACLPLSRLLYAGDRCARSEGTNGVH